MKHLEKLTTTEGKILYMLFRGWTYEECIQKLGISRASFYVHTSRLREKTGIKDTKNKQECAMCYLNRQPFSTPRAKPPLAPSPKQREAMELRADGLSFEEIGFCMSMNTQSVQNAISQGCKRAGITVHGEERITAIRALLTPPVDPMDDPAF